MRRWWSDGLGVAEEEVVAGRELEQDLAGEDVSRGDGHSTGSTGLGLAIVHAVITAHGGTATVTSSPGQTIFRLTLPI
ncbi:ATP-binding protein [Streptomyces sp. NPDC056224]|uniref:ATP-binding protein n=1 Tax=Streptomyces sp. NPDC056224 TaxID=3345750 RepID=UPI0035DB1971